MGCLYTPGVATCFHAASRRTERRLLAVACRVEPVVTHPAPPQTRTCAIHASGSSGRASAARARFLLALQSTGCLCTGLVSSLSLPCLLPADALPDGACHPVGRLGLPSPPSPVLCAATTALCPFRGLRLSLAFPIPCLLPCLWRPKRARSRVEAPDHARAFGHPVPHSGHVIKETGGSPTFPRYPSEDLPRSQTPVGSCALALPRPGLLPSGACTPSAFLSVLA